MLHYVESCGIWLPRCKRQKFTSFECSATHVVTPATSLSCSFPFLWYYIHKLFPIYESTYNSLKVPCDFILLCLCIPFSLCGILPFFSTIHLPEKGSQFIRIVAWHYLLWRSSLKSQSKCNHSLFCPSSISCTNFFKLLPFSYCHIITCIYIYLSYYTELLESRLCVSVSVSGCLSGIWSNQ